MKRCISTIMALFMALAILVSAMPSAYAAEGGTRYIYIESATGVENESTMETEEKLCNVTLKIVDYVSLYGYDANQSDWDKAIREHFGESFEIVFNGGEFKKTENTGIKLTDKYGLNLDEFISRGKISMEVELTNLAYTGNDPANIAFQIRYKLPIVRKGEFAVKEDGSYSYKMYSYMLNGTVSGLTPNGNPDPEPPVTPPTEPPTDPEDPEKETSIPKPYLMIDNYVFGGGQAVAAGNEFSLTLNFVNTSDVSLKNVMVTLDGDTSFIPVNTSSSFYIPEVKGKGRYTKVIKFYTDVSVDPKPQKVNVKMDYEYFLNDKYNEMSNAQTLTISTVQPDRFTVAKAEIPTEVYLGQEGEGAVTFKNMGKSDIMNISAEVQGDVENPGQLTLFDNMPAGKSDTFEFVITPLNEGVCNLKVIIKYEDAMGKQYEITQDYQTNAMAMQDPGMDPGMDPSDPTGGNIPMDEPKKGLNFWLIGGIAIVVIIAAVVAAKIIRKKLQEKREKELDDEDI